MPVLHEALPIDPLHAEVIIHVRSHQKRRLRAGVSQSAALRMLFGSVARPAECAAAATTSEPIIALVENIARRTKAPVVELPCGPDYLAECVKWLLQRKDQDSAFDEIVAYDLETLLRLSEAREAALQGDMFNPMSLGMPVLITGETGTGKELLARAITRLWFDTDSERKPEMKVLFVAGIPPEFVNDEMFGHAKGAFTGAQNVRPGRLEEANGHTLLIDEVGDLSGEAQIRLLRFLDRGEVSRVGENQMRTSRVRIIAATLKNLEAEVAKGNFRADLLHRLGAVRLHLPPLRDRRERFGQLVEELLRRASRTTEPAISRQALGALANHGWPGNVRELKHALNLAAASAGSETIMLDDVPSAVRRSYLKLPMAARAADLIGDEASDHRLTDDLLTYRVALVHHALVAQAPDTIPDDLAKLLEFLREIPDADAAHAAVVTRVGSAARAAGESNRTAAVASWWQQVAAVNEESRAARVIAEQRGAAEKAASEVYHEATRLRAEMRVEESGWVKMMQQVHDLPLLKGADEDDVRRVLGLAYRLVLSLPRELRDQVVRAFKDGRGLRGAWETFEPYLAESRSTEDDEPAPKPADQQDRAFWRELSKLPRMRDAEDKSGYDAKTIRKYLKHHRLRGAWQG